MPFRALQEHFARLDELESRWSFDLERYQRIFEDSPIALCCVAIDGRFLDVNEACCDIWGYDREELLQMSWQDITHPEDIEEDAEEVGRVAIGTKKIGRLYKRYRRGNKEYQDTTLVKHKTGEYFPALLSYSVARTSEGVPLFFISQIIDLEQARLWIKEAEDKYGSG